MTDDPILMNLMQYGERFVGPHLHSELPEMFPLDVWLDDGYSPETRFVLPFARMPRETTGVRTEVGDASV